MIYLTLHFFKVSYWKCLYYAICKKKQKCQHWDICYKSWKIRQVIQKKGITIVGLLIMMLLSKSLGFQKIKIVIPLLPIPTHHISCENFFGQSNFLLCRISQFSQEITLRQIINSLLSPLTNRYCCKVKRKIGL